MSSASSIVLKEPSQVRVDVPPLSQQTFGAEVRSQTIGAKFQALCGLLQQLDTLWERTGELSRLKTFFVQPPRQQLGEPALERLSRILISAGCSATRRDKIVGFPAQELLAYGRGRLGLLGGKAYRLLASIDKSFDSPQIISGRLKAVNERLISPRTVGVMRQAEDCRRLVAGRRRYLERVTTARPAAYNPARLARDLLALGAFLSRGLGGVWSSEDIQRGTACLDPARFPKMSVRLAAIHYLMQCRASEEVDRALAQSIRRDPARGVKELAREALEYRLVPAAVKRRVPTLKAR
jgi:hypothetical protein